MRLLKYSFDEASRELENLAEKIHCEYKIFEYRDQNPTGAQFNPVHQASDFLWMRSHSPSVKKGYILGVDESALVINRCKESELKLVFIDAHPGYSINLWVNRDDIVRGYVFLNISLIAENKARHLGVGEDPPNAPC